MVPGELKTRRQWLVWRFEPGEKKPKKMPYYADGTWEHRRVGKQGDEQDRRRLVTYDEALRVAPDDPAKGGVGFAFLPEDGLIGIDIDAVIDPETGVISERAASIIEACDSYTEYSPSGKGVHIFVHGRVDRSFKSNQIGLEVFCHAQFFTWTGRHYAGTPETVNAIDEAVLRRLKATVDEAKGKRGGGATSPQQGAAAADDEMRRAESALVYASADGYEDWISIGFALKNEFGEAGYGIWDRWSAKSAKYAGSEETRKRWQSFNPGPQSPTLGTVFELAKRGGWTPPRRSRRKEAPPASAQSGPPPDDAPPPPEAPPGEPSPASGDGRPEIRWKAGNLHEAVDAAEDALLRSNVKIFQRTGALVRVVRRETPSVRNYKRPGGTVGLHTVDAAFLTESFTRTARWMKWDSRLKDWKAMNAPEQAANTYLARVGHWNVPHLWSVLAAPTLRPDGTVLQKPGYDEATRSWYSPQGVPFPQIPDEPTRDDAEAALKLLRDTFKSFPWESGVDESVFMALLLTGLVRRSLPSAPLGGISATSPASGKTLLAHSISILATGAAAPAMKYPDTDEEAAKTALAILAEGDPVVLIDNVERPLQGDWLCSILTDETYRQRALGRTEMMTVPTTTLWLATGNQLVIASDLRYRSILCRLDPKCEHPEQRQFNGDLRVQLLADRPKLVAAGLTLMRAFIATDQRVADHVSDWGRFEHWTAFVRAPLVWLGMADPCESRAVIEGNDPERGELLRMLSTWWSVFQGEAKTAGDVAAEVGPSLGTMNLSTEQKQLQALLLEIAADRGGGGAISSRRLGRWLQRFVGRRVGGKQFVADGERDHVKLYRVEEVSSTATG